MKTLQLSLEQARYLHSMANEEIKSLLESNFPDLVKKLVYKWEDLDEISGFYNDTSGNIHYSSYCRSTESNCFIHPTKEDVESCIALAMLQQIILRTGNGVSYEEWENRHLEKFIITRVDNEIHSNMTYCSFSELAFKTESTHDEFIEKHLPLIKFYLKIK